MEDFGRRTFGDIRMEFVNLTRATYKEAGELKGRLNEDIEYGFKKLIIDISQCEFIDSTFLGVLVLTLKNMSKLGGNIHLVQPPPPVLKMMETVRTLDIFRTFETLDDAFISFNNTYNYK